MASLKIVDRKDKFMIEVDGVNVPYVTTYELSRSVSGIIMLRMALSIPDVEVEIESDNITTDIK